MNFRLCWVVLLCWAALPLQAAPGKIRVLIIDGINNHDWAPTTAWMRELLTRTGRFDVGVSTTPPKGAPAEAWAAWHPNFNGHEVVISNFNGGDRPDGVHWPHEVEEAFEAYVRGGGGFVSFHAANNAFYGWRAYEEMVGLLWRDKAFGPSIVIDENEKIVIVPTGEGLKAGHKERHTFQMTILDPDHPITRGLPKRWMHPSEQLTHGQHGLDEVVRSGELRILTYAWSKDAKEREPMDWVRTYGRGRVYVTMLGHTWVKEENPNLQCAGFQTMFLRGVEWAATGGVTFPVPPDFPGPDKVVVRP